MKNKKIKIGLITLLFFLGTAYLIFTGLRKTWVYYYTVDEFFEKNPKIDGKVIRLQGKVVEGTIEKKGNIVQFEIGEPNKKIRVIYKGTAPDLLFQPGAQVVVEGKYYPDENIFKATFLLTQCPSKYQGKELKESEK